MGRSAMKHRNGLAGLLWLCTVLGTAPAAFSAPIAGDVDGSGTVNAVDVQLVINGALGRTVSAHTDVDYGGSTNAADVQEEGPI